MTPNLPDDVTSDILAVSLARVVAAANRRAREMGVDANQCVIHISQDAVNDVQHWRVNYGAKNPVGRRGGDLVIDVNSTDYSIANVLRGQ